MAHEPPPREPEHAAPARRQQQLPPPPPPEGDEVEEARSETRTPGTDRSKGLTPPVSARSQHAGERGGRQADARAAAAAAAEARFLQQRELQHAPQGDGARGEGLAPPVDGRVEAPGEREGLGAGPFLSEVEDDSTPPEDAFEAIVWYRARAGMGDVDAMFNLGVCYEEGRGVAPSEKQACTWYQRAAARGDSDALFSLGVCYHDGIGVEVDARRAMDLWETAAARGNADAAFILHGMKMGSDPSVQQHGRERTALGEQLSEEGHAGGARREEDSLHAGRRRGVGEHGHDFDAGTEPGMGTTDIDLVEEEEEEEQALERYLERKQQQRRQQVDRC